MKLSQWEVVDSYSVADIQSQSAGALEHLNHSGALIIEGVLGTKLLDWIADEVRRLLRHQGVPGNELILEPNRPNRNTSEGQKTILVRGTLAKTRMVDVLAIEPTVLSLVGAILGENVQISNSVCIGIQPGEEGQSFHRD